MGLGTHDIRCAAAQRTLVFEPRALASELAKQIPRAAFAFLLGSAADGNVRRGSDLDVAVWYSGAASIPWRLLARTIAVVEAAVPGATCDLGVLNKAGYVYRFEALKGRLLFCRPRCVEVYTEFYTRTCRQYEEYCFMLSRYNAWPAA